jgi:hypothetical protein
MVNVITDRSSDHVNQLGLNVQITEPPEEPWEADSNSPITLERVVVGIDSQVDDLTVRIAAAGRGRGWRNLEGLSGVTGAELEAGGACADVGGPPILTTCTGALSTIFT